MVSIEEKLMVNILYRSESEILNGIDISTVNFENLIKLASSHLMLPALYFNINKKNCSYLFPDDFIEYIKNIFAINKARNEILLAEAKELSELLFENNINHIFLKGTALLLSNIFEDIGERMIGDIDFIIQHKDKENICVLLEKHNYSKKDSLELFRLGKPTHLPRCVNKNKKIAIEPHLELLEPIHRFVFNSKELINDFKKGVKTYKIPSTTFLFDHCVYGIQLRDKGFFTSYHSQRSIYDIYKLNCKKNLTIKKIKKDIYVKHFFLTIAKFKIFDIQIKSSILGLYYIKCFRLLIVLFFKLLIIKGKYLIIIQLFFNKELRRRALNKVSVHYHHKTLLNYIYRWLKR